MDKRRGVDGVRVWFRSACAGLLFEGVGGPVGSQDPDARIVVPEAGVEEDGGGVLGCRPGGVGARDQGCVAGFAFVVSLFPVRLFCVGIVGVGGGDGDPLWGLFGGGDPFGVGRGARIVRGGRLADVEGFDMCFCDLVLRIQARCGIVETVWMVVMLVIVVIVVIVVVVVVFIVFIFGFVLLEVSAVVNSIRGLVLATSTKPDALENIFVDALAFLDSR